MLLLNYVCLLSLDQDNIEGVAEILCACCGITQSMTERLLHNYLDKMQTLCKDIAHVLDNCSIKLDGYFF